MKLATLALATLATVATVAETVKTASQPWVTNQIAAAVAAIPSPDYSTNNTELVDTIETVAPQPGDYATVSNLAVHAVQTETDPTVPSWAKASSKPGYSYSEISGTPDLGQYATTGDVAQVSSSLADHASATNNPHHVTAAQVGALPTSGGDMSGSIKWPTLDGDGDVLVEGTMPGGERMFAITAESGNVWLYHWDHKTRLPEKDGVLAHRADIPTAWPYTAITNAPWLTSYTETDPTVPSWAKASSKPGYTLNEICPEEENWLGVQGDAGRCIKVLAGTVGGNIVGGMRVTASTLNDNNMTTYTYGGVAVRRNGTNQDYLWDGSSTNGIVRRGELASVATSGSYNDLTNAPDLGGYSTTGAVAQVARDLSAVSNVAASAVQTETDPTVPSAASAATNYTDAVAARYLPLSGGVMTGGIKIRAPAASGGYAFELGSGTGGGIMISVYDYNDVELGHFTLTPSAPKPGMDMFYDGIATTSRLEEKQDTIDDLSTIRSGAAAGATAVQQETDPTVPSWAKVTTPPYLTSETDAVALAEIVAATNALVRGPSVYFATCETAAATRAKVLVFDSADSSRLGDIATKGNTLFVKFAKAQTYNGVPQLSINGVTYLIYMVGTTGATRYEWVAGEVVQFVYDGERWMLVDAGRATTSYYGVTKLTTSVSSTSTSTALTPASLSGYIAGTIDDTPVYATNTAHAVGARARYGNYTWECTNAVAAGVAWNEADWRELPPLQTQLDDLRPSGPIATNSVIRATSGDACRVSLASGATLSAALDVEGVPVMGLIEPAGAYSVSPSIHLLGYGTWPTNSFQAVFWKVGQTTFANVLSEL